MAAELTVQNVSLVGLEPEYVAGDDVDGHRFVNDGRIMLHVVNGAAVVNITVEAAYVRDGLDLEDLVVQVPATENRMIGPFDTVTFNRRSDPHTGQVYVTMDDDNEVTLAAIRLP